MNFILLSLLSYILGSIPFSYLAAKIYKKDVLKTGTGNVGTANVWRATGKIEATLFALLGDAGKGILAVYLAKKFFPGSSLALILASFFVVLGHNFPIFLKFKGGRGLATLVGVISFLNLKAILMALFVVVLSIFLTELLMKKKIKLEGNFKEKLKGAFNIFISQVLGRMIGILAALILAFFFCFDTLLITLPAILLSLAKHIKRTKNFLEKKSE